MSSRGSSQNFEKSNGKKKSIFKKITKTLDNDH